MARSQQILVVEDDSAIRQGVVDALTFQGYRVLEAKNGTIGMEMALKVDCDLVLLDLIMPGHDGLTVLQEVRKVRPSLPVIILTARGEEADRVQGLQLGADDYVVKPFSVKELKARVEAVLRRSPERPSDIAKVEFPKGCADLARCEIRYKDGERVELSERERDLLRYLASNTGRAIARDELLLRIWRIEPGRVETRTIDMHIARLREKLRDDPENPEVILTVRGKGYMFKT
jgi:DNA-binding response OmpR family regulator